MPIVPPTTGITTGTLPTTVAPPTQSTTVPTFPTTTVPTFQNTTTAARRRDHGTTTTAGGLTQWPANTDGWTIIVASVPKSDGRATAESKAQQAKNKGLPEVGVLDGDSVREHHQRLLRRVQRRRRHEERGAEPTSRTRRRQYPDAYAKAVN